MITASSPWPDQSWSDDSSIRSSRDFQRLVRVLILGSNFQFLLALGDSPQVVQEAVDELPGAVEAAGGDPIRVTVVRPRHDLVGYEGFNALADSLQHALTTAPPEGSEFRRVLLLDGSGVGSDELPIWAELFRRLNERRNTIARTFPESVIFWLTQTLLQTLFVEAPDLWSVRSAFLQFDTLGSPAPSFEPSKDLNSTRRISRDIDPFGADVAEVAARVAEARSQLQLRPDDPVDRWVLALALLQLVDASTARGQTLQGLEAAREAQDLLQDLVHEAPDLAECWRDLSASHVKMGDLHMALGHGEQAREAYESALEIRLRLSAQEPDQVDYQRAVSVSYSRMANLYGQLGQWEQEREACELALKISERLAVQEPERADYQRDLSVSHERLGDVHAELGQWEQARQAYESSLEIAHRLAEREPDRADYQRDLSASYNKVGDVHRAFGQAEQAREAYQSSLRIAQRLAELDPHRTDYQRDLSVSYNNLGDLYRALGQGEQAQEAYQNSLRLSQRLAEREPDRADYQRKLSVSYSKLGDFYRALGQNEQALEAHKGAWEIVRRLAEQEPDRADHQRDLVVTLIKLADAEPTRARDHLTLALKTAEALTESGRMSLRDSRMVDDLRGRLAGLG